MQRDEVRDIYIKKQDVVGYIHIRVYSGARRIDEEVQGIRADEGEGKE